MKPLSSIIAFPKCPLSSKLSNAAQQSPYPASSCRSSACSAGFSCAFVPAYNLLLSDAFTVLLPGCPDACTRLHAYKPVGFSRITAPHAHEVLQQLMGHQDIEVTKRYARLTGKTREEEHFRAMAIIKKGGTDGNY